MQAGTAAQLQELQDDGAQRPQHPRQRTPRLLLRLRGQQRAQPPPQAGLEHAIRPEVVVEDARRTRVRQDVRIPLRKHAQPMMGCVIQTASNCGRRMC